MHDDANILTHSLTPILHPPFPCHYYCLGLPPVLDRQKFRDYVRHYPVNLMGDTIYDGAKLAMGEMVDG